MSEKRFVIGDDNIAMFEVIDMEKEELVCECRAVDVKTLVDLLNSLNDEIEESSSFIIEQRKENKRLNEENEYLKKRIELLSVELYCKDSKLEELGVPIECCDKK